GVAPNGIELHPVTNIVFNPSSGGGNVPPVANFSDSINGLIVAFTNTSTDSEGTVVSSAWNFGDGSTSTATSPNHAYALGGTYNVSLTVTDNGGKTNALTKSIVLSSGSSGSQLLGNTGFESSTAAPWSISAGALCTNSSCSGETAHAGSGFAWLDGYGSAHVDTASQAVTIPSGDTSATLSFWLHVDTAETTTSRAYDTLKVQVFDSSGTLLGTVSQFSNLDAASGYQQHSVNMDAYIGKSITVKFIGTEDSLDQTSFVVDGVSLNVK
ncbi:MAG TPA: PKD domain-containing protein, partial [Rhodanobacter sp.]|nr:PKD domain-containing protein [Rhodanobacter sp.]